jgi:23S rRNA (uracil1939-C5)-methyltransferase
LKKFSTPCLCCANKSFIPFNTIKKIENFLSKDKIPLILIKDKLTYWRIRAKLAVRELNKKLTIGLFHEKSHEIIPVNSCIAHHKLITKSVLTIENKAKLFNIIPFNESSLKGELKYVQISVNDVGNFVQIALVINCKKASSKIQKFIQALSKYKFIESIWVNYNINTNNVIFSNQWDHFYGSDFLTLNILKKEFSFHPAAFMQAHLKIFEKMIKYIESKVTKNSSVLELYAGIGAIGLSLISKCRKLTLVENNPFSKLSFDRSFSLSFLKYRNKVSYLCQDAASIDDFDQFDLIILDPPRKGLSKELLKRLAKLNNKTIIYVSCNFITFEKDVTELKKNNWQIRDVKCFLMFPSSEHFEIIGILKKNV